MIRAERERVQATQDSETNKESTPSMYVIFHSIWTAEPS